MFSAQARTLFRLWRFALALAVVCLLSFAGWRVGAHEWGWRWLAQPAATSSAQPQAKRGARAAEAWWAKLRGLDFFGSLNSAGLAATAFATGGGLRFDGVDDDVSFSSTGLSTSAGTISFWMNQETTSVGVPLLFDSGTENYAIFLGGNTTLYFRAGSVGIAQFSTTAPAVGEWHHIAMTWAGVGQPMIGYVDGVQVGTVNQNIVGSHGTTGHFGNSAIYPVTAASFKGRLDDVRVWTVARTAAEIQADMNSELTGMLPAGLVRYWKLNEGTAYGNNTGVTTATDATGNADGTLANFALSGCTSNWACGAPVLGACTPDGPEIDVKGNNVLIADGDTTPSTADHTDFGSVSAASGSVTRTYTIENTGTLALTVTGITMNGANAADFTLSGLPSFPATINANNSTTFTVTFDPSATGTRTATINIANSDCDEATYDFAIQGTGANTAPTVAADAGSKLFIARYISANFIARANVDGTGLNTTHFALPNNAIGVTVDTVNGKLYWSTLANGGSVGRMNLDGSGAEPNFLPGVHTIGMAVDTVNGWLYLTGGAVKRVRLDGTGLQTLIPGLDIPGLTSCSGVALDVPNNKLYYAFNTAIGRADLDGTNHTPAYITTAGGAPTDDVAIDRTNGKLYWTVSGGNKIGRANVDGTVIESSFLSVTAPRSLIVDPQAGKVFWSDGSGVGRANLDGTGVNASFLTGVSGSWGIAVGDVDVEGTQATRTGTYSDPDGNTVTLSANIGTVQKDVPSAGKWTWTYTPPDGPVNHNVTITANDGSTTSTTSFTVNVNNIAPTIALTGANSTPPNTAYALNLGAITDPGTDTVTGFSINWGDGTTENFSGSPVNLVKSHNYTTIGDKTIRVALTDEDGTHSDAGLKTVTVTDPPPTLTRSNTAVTVNEGSVAANSGTFGDQQGNNNVTLSASLGTVTKDDAAGTWSWTYTAPDGPDGPTTVTITANDGVNAAVTTTFSLTVNNVAPKLNQCGPPVFTLITTSITGWHSAAADFDNDGDQDIVTTSPNGGVGPIFYRNNGSGSFTSVLNLGDGHGYPVTAADVNGDGKPDVIALGKGKVFQNDGNFTFSAGPTFTSTTTNGVYEDVSGDGVKDMVVGSFSTDGKIAVHLGIAGGGFGAATTYTVSSGSLIYVALADYTGDGKLDIAAARDNDDQVTLLINNGSGGFTTGNTFTVGDMPRGLAAGDFNNDGKQDLAVPNFNSSNVSILLGNGAGSFSPATNVSVGTGPHFILVTDFNNDGKQDLAVARSISGPDKATVLGGNGDGTFGTPTDYGDQSQLLNIFLADMNNDGALDIVLGQESLVQFVQANVAPTMVTVNEGATAMNSGTFCDPGADTVTITASISTVTQNNANGTWSWSFATNDGTAQNQQVTITATDSDNEMTTYKFNLVVNNLNPTATFANGGAVNEGSSGTVSFTNQADASAPDTNAGFRYAYDFNNDGTFDGGTDGTYAGSSTSASVTVPASFLADGSGMREVKGRIIDKDNGFTEYLTTITINNVKPTATFAASSNATVNEGTAAPPSVSFTNPIDPGTPDATTLRYSYDYNNDGVWEVGDGTYSNSVTTTSQTIPASYFATPAPTQLVVKGRILDKDGEFTDYTLTFTINHAPTAINGPLVIVEDFDYGTSGGSLAGQNGGAGFSTAWSDGSYTATGLTFSNLSSPGGAWNGSSGSRNFAATLAAAGPITGDFLFRRPIAGPVQMFGLGGFNNQGYTIALAPSNDSNGGTVPVVGLQGSGFANITTSALDPNTTYMYRFAYASPSITAWILSAAQYDNFAPGGITDAELNAATIGSDAAQVTGRVTKAGNVTSNMANLFTYTFGGSGVTMDRLRMTGQPVGASLAIAENQPVNTTVGTLLASDADANETHLFELVDSVNYPDNNSFTITGSTLKSNAIFNYETKNSYSIRVKVTDSGGLTYETTLPVTITNVNEQPTVANTIANQTAMSAFPFNFTFAANTFADVDVPTNFTYTATKSNGSALPTWLTFTPGTRTFSGTPAVSDAGTITVKVTATDDGSPTLSTSTTFDLTVNTPTLSVSKSNPALTYNQNSTYVITVTNTGAGAASTATVKEALPAGMKLVSATGTNWTCSPTSGSSPVGTITCTFSSTANPIAASGGTSTINIVACPIVGGSLTNKVSVDPSGGTSAPNPTTCTGSNTPSAGCGAPVTTTVSGAPTETVSKSGTGGATPVGGNGTTTINWRINYGVSNTTPIPLVTLNDTWSSGQTLIGASVQTPGGLWASNQPNSTSLNFSNALVAPNGKGQTQAFPRPLAGGVSFNGAGDGFNPAITASGKVMGVNHHLSNSPIWCYDLNTGQTCAGYDPKPANAGATGYSPVTVAIGNRIYYSDDSSNTGFGQAGRIYCWDSDTNSSCGQSPQVNNLGLAVVNGKLFTQTKEGYLDCYDPANGLNRCGGFTPVNLGMPTGSTLNFVAPNDEGGDIFAVGTKIYVANYERKLTCFDATTNTTCAGWPTLPNVVSTTATGNKRFNIIPRLNAGGTITGVCVVGYRTNATCYNFDGSNATEVTMGSGNGAMNTAFPGLSAHTETWVGSRIFFANHNSGNSGIGCFDWATLGPCTGAGFDSTGQNTTSSGSAYGLANDGVSVYSFGDHGVLRSYHPLTGVSPSNRIATIATVNVDSFYCGATSSVAATWNKVILSDINLTAGVEFNSVLVSVIDTNTGTTVFGPTEAVGTTGIFDISSISPSLRSLRLQIEEAPVNTVAWDDGVPPKGTLTFTNNTAVQFCYQTQVSCTGNSTIHSNTIATNIDAQMITAEATTCGPTPNLALGKSEPSPALLIGQNSTYTLTVTNNGTADATTATVKDTLPTGLDLVSATGTNWTCTPSGATSSPVSTITCNFSGSIAANGGTSTINIVAKPILGYGNSTVINYASVDPSGGTSPPPPTNCTAANTPAGCAAPVSNVIPPNSPPSITGGATAMRQQGAAGTSATIATVSDNETAKKDLVVSVMSAPTGINITSISAPDATTGEVTATVAAACNAALGDNTVMLKVTDGGTLTTTANLTVNVTAHNLATTALSSQTVFAGATVMFSTTASGSGPYMFVWKKGATVLASGITTNGATSTLTLTSVQAADAATYSVEVTGACATVSQSATLGVTTPTLAINDVTKAEGDSGTTSFDFTVTLSPASPQTVTVSYVTANHTAIAPGDFTALLATTLTFQPNETMKTISVLVKGETMVEAAESFYVNLSSATNATITDQQGTGMINNDDSTALSISDVTVTEGSSGTVNAVFDVTLANPSDSSVTVNYATADQSATVGNNDYTATSGTLTFAPNATLQTISVPIKGDTATELNETFVVNLSGASGATISKSQGVGTIKNDDGVIPELTVGLIDPAVCLSPNGLIGVTATVFNPNNATVNAAWSATFPAQLIGLVGSGTATVNQAGIQVTTTQVTWMGTLTPGQSVTFTYQAQIAANTPPDVQLCIQNSASFNGGTPVQVPECFVANCPGTGLLPIANVRAGGQKAGSLLVFPYYTSRTATQSDTRLSLTNTGAQQAYVHLFMMDGATCQQADFFVCLTPNATFSFKTSEYDPDSTGFVYAVAVDTQGRPVPHNGLIGNAFVRDGGYVDNYAAEAFWRYDANPTTVENGVALLHLNGGVYDAAPMQFSAEIQSPLDSVGQKIVLAPLSGDLTGGIANLNSTNPTMQTAAGQIGIGLAANEQEKIVSFSAMLSGGCLKSATIGTTFPRVPNGVGNLIPTGKTGFLQFRVGAGVGLLMTPRTGANKWYGIRALHKTAMTNTVIAIPVFVPVC